MFINLIQLTDRKACIRWAFTVDKGFPLTNTVNVSSFSVVIRLPNQDRFVSSGDESGVKWTSSEETEENWIEHFRWINVSIVGYNQGCVPCNFLLWNLGLPRKLFLILVSLVFQSWPPVLLHVDPVITGGGAPICGEPGGVITTTIKGMLKIFMSAYYRFSFNWCKSQEQFLNDSEIGLTITIVWFSKQWNSYCWTRIGSMMNWRWLLFSIRYLVWCSTNRRRWVCWMSNRSWWRRPRYS